MGGKGERQTVSRIHRKKPKQSKDRRQVYSSRLTGSKVVRQAGRHAGW